jgi:hypothetical protein
LLKGSDVFYTPYIFPITTSNQFPLVSPSAWPLSQSVNRKSHKQASKQFLDLSAELSSLLQWSLLISPIWKLTHDQAGLLRDVKSTISRAPW